MDVTARRDHDAITVTVTGEVDLASVGALTATADEVLAGPAGPPLVLDLAAVTFIDSVGIGALVAIRNAARARDVALTLRNVARPVRRVLEIANLDTVFVLLDD